MNDEQKNIMMAFLKDFRHEISGLRSSLAEMEEGNDILVEEWEDICISLAYTFISRYFDDTDNWWWVGQEIGGILCVNDYYFFDVNRIIQAFKLKASYEQLMNYHEAEVEDRQEGKHLVNFTNYVKYGKLYAE